VQPIDATLTLANPRLTKATALGANGTPKDAAVPVSTADGQVRLKLPPGTLYLILTP
jgi:hypothetical protein